MPSRVTISPSTSTSPASISSSHLRREATFDWASSFWSLIRPSSSVSRVTSRPAPVDRAVRGLLGGHGAQLVLEVVHLREVRRQLGELVERGHADPLQEVAAGAVERGAVLAVLAGLLHQPTGEQRAHHPVDVDASDRRHPCSRYGLFVGDDRERLERGLGQPRLLSLEHETLDDRCVVVAGVVAPASCHVAQLEAAPLFVVLRRELAQRGDDLLCRIADRRRQGGVVERLVGDHQHCLQRRPEVRHRYVEGLLLGRLGHAVVSSVGGAPSNSSVTRSSAVASSGPVHRTLSSPRADTCSNATAPSR